MGKDTDLLEEYSMQPCRAVVRILIIMNKYLDTTAMSVSFQGRLCVRSMCFPSSADEPSSQVTHYTCLECHLTKHCPVTVVTSHYPLSTSRSLTHSRLHRIILTSLTIYYYNHESPAISWPYSYLHEERRPQTSPRHHQGRQRTEP